MMSETRLKEIDSNINCALNNVRQSDLLKNVAVGDYYLKKFEINREDILFSQLANIPIGKSISLPSIKGGSIITTNVTKNTNGERLFFEVAWTPGATLVMHKHSNAEEKIVIRVGLFQLITEDLDGNKHRFTLKKGDEINIAPGQYHQITALEKGRMSIKFIRTNGKNV